MTTELNDIKELSTRIMKAPLKFINYHDDAIIAHFEVGGTELELKDIEEFHNKLGLKHKQVAFFALGMKISKPDISKEDIIAIKEQSNTYTAPKVMTNPVPQPMVSNQLNKAKKEAEVINMEGKPFPEVMEKMAQNLMIKGYKDMVNCCEDKGEEGLRKIVASKEIFDSLKYLQ